ncbi:palindromic element RPE1 domain-containing protein [Rickettsia hoogstraalii]|uniref:palindromic element RPE1 domain-containing protein n=1 Tax=Rickettsia hoogstraalii TaxID=467174 RepID=UPI002256D770|nr:palindromic element RPE1 domain-containing protein [Rickettsia hoogstraalii]MCX4083468.1 palindromic element RPE1 domain-containing protein [Rickettsia hoogstraalii]
MIYAIREDSSTGSTYKLPLEVEFQKKSNIDLNNAEIAIITHAYHFPRVNRYFDNKPNFDFFFIHNTKPIIFLVDRKFEASGVDNELKQELIKLPIYIEKGFVSEKLNANI